MKRIRETLLTIGWAVRLALRINAGLFLLWGAVGVLLAVLPAAALQFNRQSVAILSAFLATGQGTFADVLPSLLALGVVLTAVGVSRRINGSFLYLTMYDAYYFGMQEYLMDAVSRIELKALFDRGIRDQHHSALGRCGALTDFMSSGCLFLIKFAGAMSLLVVAAGTSWVLCVLSAGYVAAMLLLNVLTADRLRWDGRPYTEATRLSNYYQTAAMTPGVAKEIRVYGLADEMVANWDTAYERAVRIDRRYVRARQLVAFLGGAGYYLFLAAMLGYSIVRVARGTMGVDVFLMLYALGQSLSDTVQAMSSGFQEADRGLFFLRIQRRFVRSVPQTVEDWTEGFRPEDEGTVFHAEGLCFSYDDRSEVLHDLTFDIRKGETIALVGVNGSGKTTLVKLLIGLFAPTGGRLLFHGKPYDNRTRGAVMARVGMFFQDFYIFHSTLRENVGFGDLKNLGNTPRILQAMEKGGAQKLPGRFPKGLEHWLGRDVVKDGAMLSGGEKQRVAVSRAHMSDRDILIFDEPAAALDPIAEMVQFQAIREKIEGRTAILISHRVGFARLADRILVLDGGQLVSQGSHEELMAAGGLYARLFHEQAQWYDTEGEQAHA